MRADGVPGRARVVAMLTRSSYLGKLMAALARIYTRRLAWASWESQSRVYGAVKLAIDTKGRCFVDTEQRAGNAGRQQHVYVKFVSPRLYALVVKEEKKPRCKRRAGYPGVYRADRALGKAGGARSADGWWRLAIRSKFYSCAES